MERWDNLYHVTTDDLLRESALYRKAANVARMHDEWEDAVELAQQAQCCYPTDAGARFLERMQAERAEAHLASSQ